MWPFKTLSRISPIYTGSEWIIWGLYSSRITALVPLPQHLFASKFLLLARHFNPLDTFMSSAWSGALQRKVAKRQGQLDCAPRLGLGGLPLPPRLPLRALPPKNQVVLLVVSCLYFMITFSWACSLSSCSSRSHTHTHTTGAREEVILI